MTISIRSTMPEKWSPVSHNIMQTVSRTFIAEHGNPGILRWLEVIPTVTMGTPMLQVLDVFRDNQHEHFFPVLDSEGKAVGLICERSLKSYVYSHFGVALLANRNRAKVLEDFITPCPCVEFDEPTSKVLDAVHKLTGAEGVIITANGRYVGFMRTSTLVELAHEQQIGIVKKHNLELDRKNNEIQAVLKNMRQGFCTILPDLILHPDYSAHLVSILEQDNIAGQSIMDVLFSYTETGADQLQQIEAALAAMLGQDELMYECNSHLLPHELHAEFAGKAKILELHWSPMSNNDSVVERVMLVVRDITQMRKLQQQAVRQQRELQVLGEILNAGQKRFSSFMRDSERSLAECWKILEHSYKNGNNDQSGMVAAMFRQWHTLKGNARTLGLNSVTDNLHEAEQVLQSAREGGYAVDLKDIQTALERIAEDFVQYSAVYHQRISNFVGSLEADNELVRPFPLIEVFSCVCDSLPALAKELGKETPQLDVQEEADTLFISAQYRSCLESVMTHIFRNSLDHGIETLAERLAAGKAAEPVLKVCVESDADVVRLIVSDDGRGLDIESLRNKAYANGLISSPGDMSDDEAADLIFHPGLSTAKHVTLVSGRGVGMDAVRHLLSGVGASIRVQLLAKVDDELLFQPFALHIDLPVSMLEKQQVA